MWITKQSRSPIRATQIAPAKFDAAGVKPGRDWLDSFLADRPVGILDNSQHILMMNSRALELTGIDENTF